MKKLILLALPGCIGSTFNINLKNPAWPEAKCIKKVDKEIVVEAGKTFDMGGCEYRWTGKYADKCDALEEYSESVPKMFKLKEGATLRNGQIRCSPDGVEMAAKSRIENVKIHVEEDGVNVGKGGPVYLKNVDFYYASDKAIQMNPGAGDLTCENCKWFHTRWPIKIDGKGDVVLKNPKFFNVQRGVTGNKGAKTLRVEGGSIEKADCLLSSDLHAKASVSRMEYKGVTEGRCK